MDATVPRWVGMVEDVREADSIEELRMLESLVPDYPEVDVPEVRGSIEERRKALDRVGKEVVTEAQVVEMLKQLEELKAKAAPVRPEPLRRSSRKYKFVHDRLDWTNKRQAHVLMAILKSRWQIGDVLDEDDMLELVRANAEALETIQDPGRVWAYYKGSGGFTEHGNIERTY